VREHPGRFAGRANETSMPHVPAKRLKRTRQSAATRPPRAAPAAPASRRSSAPPDEAQRRPEQLLSIMIGTRLRHARLMRGLRMKEVADAAMCSESLVSKIENNKVQPSIQVLHRLCDVLKIPLNELFDPQKDDDPVVSRQGHRMVVDFDPLRPGTGIKLERVIPYAKGHLLQSNIHLCAPGGTSFGLISHEGEEVGYVIAGQIELFVGDRSYLLSPGDTFLFRSETPHGYRNRGTEEARILFVNTPPTF
jgi:transcriptional regulator with XRE-family HTH domain